MSNKNWSQNRLNRTTKSDFETQCHHFLWEFVRFPTGWLIGEERLQSIDCFRQAFLTESGTRMTENSAASRFGMRPVAVRQNAYGSLFLR
jgi:hypothetical protein